MTASVVSSPGGSGTSPRGVTVLLPVYDDWEAAGRLLERLDRVLAPLPEPRRIVVVDDGSTHPPELGWGAQRFDAIDSLELVSLRFNVGHQRAIAIGLCHVYEQGHSEAVVVMDADGEDDPNDVPRLWEALRSSAGQPMVFAARLRRSEGLWFATGYHLYRAAHRVLTGLPVRIGNFSVVPRRSLESLVYVPDLWNHYAASVVRTRLPRLEVPTARASRLAGRGRMSLVALVTHGLSALAVFGETVGVRLMMIAICLVAGLGLVLAAAAVLPVTGWSLPPRTALALAAVAAVLLVQVLAAAGALALFILNARGESFRPPIEVYRSLIRHVGSVPAPDA